MENIIWLLIMIPCSAIFTGIGIYAWRRKKPMWFWSGSAVDESKIRDIKAYNKANGIMWIVFSIPMWLSTFAVIWNRAVAGALIIIDCTVGLGLLVVTYNRIYKKYKN